MILIIFINNSKIESGMKVIDVLQTDPAANVCNQELREIFKNDRLSIAHVIMEKGNVSLLHSHKRIMETYFILSGTGVLHYGNGMDEKYLEVRKGAHASIAAGAYHKLKNIGDGELSHLVISTPPFDADDVFLLEQNGDSNLETEIYENKNPEIEAQDGALVQELGTADERRKAGFGLAFGKLLSGKKANVHYHKRTEELYYMVSGDGLLWSGDSPMLITQDSLIQIPRNLEHGLQNHGKKPLEVLCISWPPFESEDFYLR